MPPKQNFNLGIMFRRENPPEALPEFARQAEAAGFDELWVVEDCFYASGIAPAAAALAVTDSIRVGLGIMPAVARNPVFTAMEIATLARMFPGRFLPGIGHGMAGWMHQIGAFPRSQLKALRETTQAVCALLRGEKFSFDGNHVHLEEAQLVHPPDQIPPISLGVRGPKSLAISGKEANGTILAEFSSPEYVAWAQEQITAGQLSANITEPHRITVFAWATASEDTETAHQVMRPIIAPAIASGKVDMQLSPMGIVPQAKKLLETGGLEYLQNNLPGEWINRLSIAGTSGDWKNAIQRYVSAGADTVVLVPLAEKGLEELRAFADHYQKN